MLSKAQILIQKISLTLTLNPILLFTPLLNEILFAINQNIIGHGTKNMHF